MAKNYLVALLSLFVFFEISSSWAQDRSCFSNPSLRISIRSFTNGITEEKFNRIIDQVAQIHAPQFKARRQKLTIKKKWNDDKVSARAYLRFIFFGAPIIEISGGLARHPELTADGLALIACHEIGHHLGGAPKILSIDGPTWNSLEGQADYYSSLKCLRRVFAKDDNRSLMEARQNVPLYLKQQCESRFKDSEEAAICIRSALAGKSAASTTLQLEKGEKEIDFHTPDPTVVASIIKYHPNSQCRLDTYLQGALCDAPVDEALNKNDPHLGACSRQWGQIVGARPQCWYKAPQ